MFSVNDKFIKKYEDESSYTLDDSINAYAYLDTLVGNLFKISHRKTSSKRVRGLYSQRYQKGKGGTCKVSGFYVLYQY